MKFEYDYDAEAEIERLQRELRKEEERTHECQREIKRLRSIGRNFYQAKANLDNMNEDLLFESWANLYDGESPESVIKVIKEHGLENVDAVSFMAYCGGFHKAASYFKEV
jgi:hypothetical protein